MDMGTITAAWEGLKIGKELLGLAVDAKADAAAQAKVHAALDGLGKAQDTLFSLREELFKLQEANDQLRKELAQAKSWDDRIGQYELAKTAGGAVAYRFKLQPEHYACPTCVNKREIQVLQDNRTRSGKYRCTGCGSEFPIEPRGEDPPIHYTTQPLV